MIADSNPVEVDGSTIPSPQGTTNYRDLFRNLGASVVAALVFAVSVPEVSDYLVTHLEVVRASIPVVFRNSIAAGLAGMLLTFVLNHIRQLRKGEPMELVQTPNGAVSGLYPIDQVKG